MLARRSPLIELLRELLESGANMRLEGMGGVRFEVKDRTGIIVSQTRTCANKIAPSPDSLSNKYTGRTFPKETPLALAMHTQHHNRTSKPNAIQTLF